MKLHDNSCIRGILIILCSPSNLFERKGLIEADRSIVGSTNLQKNGSLKTGHERCDECAAYPHATELRRYSNVENLAFVRTGAPGNQEPGNPIVAYRHTKIVRQIIPHVPLGGLGRSRLNRGDAIEVRGAARSNCWDNH